MEIFVTGSSGAVGRPLVAALTDAGHRVLAATRRPGDHVGPGTPVAFDLDADPRDPSAPLDPEGVAADADAAYYLVHALERRDFSEVDRARAERFADWWGPDRPVVYLGALGALDTPSEHLRSRHEVGQILRDRCRAVELGASLVLGPDSLSFQLLTRLGGLAGRWPLPVPVPESAETRTQPVAQGDLTCVLVGALDLAPGAYDVGGPDVLSYRELMELGAEAQGRSLDARSVIPLDAAWAGPASSLLAGTDPWATSGLFAGMSTEAVVRPGRELPVRLRPTTGVADAVRQALAADAA